LQITWWQLAAGGGIAKAWTRAKGAVPHCRWDELRPRLWQTACCGLVRFFLLYLPFKSLTVKILECKCIDFMSIFKNTE